MQRLFVGVRSLNEAVKADNGGSYIADVAFPASALGTPYRLNITVVRNRLDEAGFQGVPISTNIGEDQHDRAAAWAPSTSAAGIGELDEGLVRKIATTIPQTPHGSL